MGNQIVQFLTGEHPLAVILIYPVVGLQAILLSRRVLHDVANHYTVALPEGIARTISDDTDVGQEVSKKKQFILDARKSAEEFADRFKEQKEFIKIVLECKDLVEEIKRKFDRGEDVEPELGLLIQRKNELASANREILRKFDEIEKTCREKGYSNRILDRQTKMVKQHKESTRILMRHLETVAKQRDRDRLLEEIEKLEKYFSENKFKEDPLGQLVGNLFDFQIEVTP